MVIFCLNSTRRTTCLVMSVILFERANWRAVITTFGIITLSINPDEINLSYYIDI